MVDYRKERIEIDLEGGQAIYESIGECVICGKRVYKCTSHPIRADHELEDRVAWFKADGYSTKDNIVPPTPYCQTCFGPANRDVLQQQARGKTVLSIEERWFPLDER